MLRKLLFFTLAFVKIAFCHDFLDDDFPSKLFQGLVDVTTGNLVYEKDLVIEGKEPVILNKRYLSIMNFDPREMDEKNNEEFFDGGWRYNKCYKAFFYDDHVDIVEPYGLVLTYSVPQLKEFKKSVFETKKEKEKRHKKIQEEKERHHVLQLLRTRFLSEYSNEKVDPEHINNIKLTLEGQHNLRVRYPNGVEKLYRREDAGHNDFVLLYETLLNKNRIYYKFDGFDNLLEIKTTNPNGTKIYAKVNFAYSHPDSSYNEKNKDKKDFTISTSDQRSFRCGHFNYFPLISSSDRSKHPFFLLENFSSNQENESFKYYLDLKRTSPVLSDAYLANGNSFHVDYYFLGNKNPEVDVVIEDSQDRRFLRVSYLKTNDNSYTFLYDPGVLNYKQGSTTIFNKNRNKIVYKYSKDFSLESVEKYKILSNQYVLVSKELYNWTYNKTNNKSYLLSKAYMDENSNVIFAKSFLYDSRKNIIQEKIYGKISGTNKNSISLDFNNFPMDSNVETYQINYLYSQDSKNLLLSKEENDMKTTYSYLPNSNLISSEFVSYQNEIKLRTFYEYNADNVLIKEIYDDGTSKNKTNLTDVSRRNIKIIRPRNVMPFISMRDIVEERSVDLKTNEEKLLKKEKYHYSNLGKVIKKDIFDENNTYMHSIADDSEFPSKDLSKVQPHVVATNIYDQPLLLKYLDESQEGYIYNLDKTINSYIDQEGVRTTYTYDFLQRITSEKIYSPDDRFLCETKYKYNSFDLISKTDPLGNITNYEYDFAGRKIAEEFITITSNTRTEYAYDSKTKEYTTKYASNLKDVTKKDFSGNTIEIRKEDEDNNLYYLKKYEYDNNNNLIKSISFIDDQTSIEEYKYDNQNRIIEKLDPKKNRTSYLYENNKMTETNHLLHKTIVSLDENDNEILKERKSSENKLLSREEKAYDNHSNLIKIKNTIFFENKSKSKETFFEYDNMHRLVVKKDINGSDSKITKYSYTKKGRLHKTIKPDGIIITRKYDPFGNVISLKSSDGSIHYKYSYNKLNELTFARDLTNDIITKRIVNSNNKILEEKLANDLSIKYEYDLSGRKKMLILPDNSSVSYFYNPCYLKEIKRKDSYGYQIYSHSYLKYDLSSNLIEEELLGDLGTSNYKRNLLGKMLEMDTPFGLHKVEKYDSLGRIEKLKWNIFWGIDVVEYSYNDFNQVISESGLFDNQYFYGSDTQKQDDEIDLNNDILQPSMLDYEYDKNDNLIRVKTDYNEVFYRYDALDRLVELEEKENQKIQFSYDGLNRRISKTKYKYNKGYWKKDSYLAFIYENDTEIGAVDENNKIVQLRILGHDNKSIAFELNNEIFAPLYDVMGNVGSLISLNQGLVESYRYSAYGDTLICNSSGKIRSNSAFSNPWQYLSNRIDEETSLVFFKNSYYSPKMGMWLSKDITSDMNELYLEGEIIYTDDEMINNMKDISFGVSHLFETSFKTRLENNLFRSSSFTRNRIISGLSNLVRKISTKNETSYDIKFSKTAINQTVENNISLDEIYLVLKSPDSINTISFEDIRKEILVLIKNNLEIKMDMDTKEILSLQRL